MDINSDGPVWIPQAKILAKHGCPFLPMFPRVGNSWAFWPLDATEVTPLSGYFSADNDDRWFTGPQRG